MRSYWKSLQYISRVFFALGTLKRRHTLRLTTFHLLDAQPNSSTLELRLAAGGGCVRGRGKAQAGELVECVGVFMPSTTLWTSDAIFISRKKPNDDHETFDYVH